MALRHARLRIVSGCTAAAAALAVASVAFACTAIQGFTWYADGTFDKSGPAGTVITAYATAARPNSNFMLVSGNSDGDPAHADHACMFNFVNINPSVRTSNASGFIGLTGGAVNRPAGEWQICFRQTNGATGTSPVFFTIVGG